MWKWNLVLKFDEKSSLQSNPSAEPQTVQKIRRELGSLLNLFNNRASWQLYVNTRWWELPNPKPNQVWIMLVGLQAPGMVPNCFRVTDWQMFFSWKEGTANNAKKKEIGKRYETATSPPLILSLHHRRRSYHRKDWKEQTEQYSFTRYESIIIDC